MKKARVKEVTIPYEIMADIFSRLSIQDFSECKLVCKAWYKDWRGLTRDPLFTNNMQQPVNNSQFLVFCHNNEDIYLADNRNPSSPLKAFKTSFDYLQGKENIDIIGSANGLLCLCLWDKKTFFVCNPITKDILKLPEATYHGTTTTGFRSSTPLGFAFDASTGTYKVIHTWSYYQSDEDIGYVAPETGVQIYTLRTQKWKKIRNTRGVNTRSSKSSQVLLNGSLHWYIFSYISARRYRDCIASFDITKETFQLFKMPRELCLSDQLAEDRTLGSVSGNLCVVDVGNKVYEICVWIMERYGEKNSWSKKYVIHESVFSTLREQIGCFESLRIVSEGSILLQGSKGQGYYDLKKEKFEEIVIKGIQPWTEGLEIVAHVGGLVSPITIHGTTANTP